MGSTAEIVAKRFGITRTMMDEFAVESHRRVAFAQDNGHLTEVEPMYGPDGKVYAADDGVRRDSSVEKLAKLRPVFDRTYGNVTAGNSSQVTDGAAMLVLASEDVVNEYGLKPLGRIVDTHWGALDPSEMGLGPVHAITPLLHAPRPHAGTTSTRPRSTRRSPRRCWAASPRGRRARTCKEHFGARARRSASSTARS